MIRHRCLVPLVAPATLAPPAGRPLPDVYDLIMDAYERDDVLLEMHNFDITPILRELEARGFYVARGSLSKFRETELSLTSVLNLHYVQSFQDVYSPRAHLDLGDHPEDLPEPSAPRTGVPGLPDSRL